MSLRIQTTSSPLHQQPNSTGNSENNTDISEHWAGRKHTVEPSDSVLYWACKVCLAYLKATSPPSQAGVLLSCSSLPVALLSSPLTFLPSLFLKSLPTPLSLSPLISIYIVLLNPADVASVTSICLSVCQAAVPRH